MELNLSNSDQFSNLRNEANLFDLEEQCHILVDRVHFLENQLLTSRTQEQETILSKMVLERNLDKEKRDSTDTKAQLKAIQSTMQQWEQDRSNLKETAIQQSFQLESLKTERNLLNEQVSKLEVENVQLKLKIDEIEKQLKNQQNLEKLVNSKKLIIDSLFDEIYKQNQKLENEILWLKRKITVAKYIGEQIILLLRHHHLALNKVNQENDSLKQIILTRKRDIAKVAKTNQPNLAKINSEEPQNQLFMQNNFRKQEDIIIDLKNKLVLEVEEKKKLNDNLKIVLEQQIKFNEMEYSLRNQIQVLQEQLKEKDHFVVSV